MTAVDELRLPGWPDVGDVQPADRRVLVAVAAAAVGTDLAVRSGVVGFAGALLVVVVSAGALATGRATNRRAWPVIAAAIPFGICLATRTSPWLLPFDILACAALLLIGASFSREGDSFDVTIPNLAGRSLHGFIHGVLAPGFLLSARRKDRGDRPRRDRRSAAVLRGAILAAPVVGLIGLLLGSADPVFASIFSIPSDAGDLLIHAVLLAIGAWGAAGLLRLASAAPFATSTDFNRPLGAVEGTTVLTGLVAIFIAFAASQVVAAVRGAAYVQRTAGLSYAEYARTGFFQLLAVAAITLGVLLALRATTNVSTSAERLRFLVLSELAVLLTLVIVGVAVRRLNLYEHAYGLTMLRLCSMLFALWIAAVFVLLGVSLAGVWSHRAWLVPTAAAVAVAGLLAVNAANPEALVVRRNVDRFGETDKLDVSYLKLLSDDAAPEIARSLDRLSPSDAAELQSWLCQGDRRASGGFWAYNASRDAAIEARNQACPSR